MTHIILNRLSANVNEEQYRSLQALSGFIKQTTTRRQFRTESAWHLLVRSLLIIHEAYV